MGKVVALIPAFNEAERIGPVIEQTQKFVSEIWVVDDGSLDNTAERARRAGAHVLSHAQNLGKGASLIDGFEVLAKTDAEIIILLDGDGQHNPREIPRFLEKQRQTGATLVVGNRLGDVHGMPLVRRFTNRIMSWLLSQQTGQSIPDCSCGFRLVHRSLLSDLNLDTRNYETDQEMLLEASRKGHRIASVPISTIYAGAPSHIRPLRDAWRFLRLLCRYYRRP